MILYTLQNKKTKQLGNVVIGDGAVSIKRNVIALATDKDKIAYLSQYNIVRLADYDEIVGLNNLPKKPEKLLDISKVLKGKK